jgi:hypothetical protein
MRLPAQVARPPPLMIRAFGAHCQNRTHAVQQNSLRGRDASYLAPPAQIRTCGFPAYGSHLGSERQSSCRTRSGACDTRAWR